MNFSSLLPIRVRITATNEQLRALHEMAPQMISVAECMILDGVDERHYVAEYVQAVLNGQGFE